MVHNKKYFSLLFILTLPFLFPACGGRRSKESDPNYVPARVRKEQRKQKRIAANYQAEFDAIKSRYADETRMLRSLEKKNLEVAQQDEILKKELKKIIMLKGSSALTPGAFCMGGLGNNNAPFLFYKNTLESDMRTLQQKSNTFASYDWHNEYDEMLTKMHEFLAKLDQIYDMIYLDIDVVRDAQMVAMDFMIKQLESENHELEKQLQVKKETPVTVVINNASSETDEI